MNFEHILEHHLVNHHTSHWFFHGIDFGMSPHLMTLWLVSGVVVLLMNFAARSSSEAGRLMRGGVEAVVVYLRDEMLHPIFHDATETYLPYFLTLFFFIFTANLVGLVPSASAITANPSVTGALALCTFGLINFAGMKEQGPFSYVKHIVPGGVPWWMWLLIFAIELIGLLAKCIALCIRLFANILSGHVVSLAFLSLIFVFAEMNHAVGLAVSPFAVGLALFVVTLDILVALLQAYIFTFLTAIFVGGAVHPH